MKRPEDDVHLTDGDGFMVQEGPFQAHLKVAVEIKQVCISFIVTRHATCLTCYPA